MKKFLILICLFFLFSSANAETLRGGTVYDEIPKGFFGTWHVTSKLLTLYAPKEFSPLSVDIWNLSGQGNVLILENMQSGATSSIQMASEGGNYDGKTLKFERSKKVVKGNVTIIERESPEFVLEGDIFRGFDTFYIEKYKDDKHISTIVIQYKVLGQKISGESRIE